MTIKSDSKKHREAFSSVSMHPSSAEGASLILGVDPGTQVCGYGLISSERGVYRAIDYGSIRPPRTLKLSDRYLVIFDSIEHLIKQHMPQAVVVETQYVDKNVQSVLKLGIARGAVILASKRQGIAVFEYTPTMAKKGVVGWGRASKVQVQGMVQQWLRLPAPPESEDAADALALAIRHAQLAPHMQAQYEI